MRGTLSSAGPGRAVAHAPSTPFHSRQGLLVRRFYRFFPVSKQQGNLLVLSCNIYIIVAQTMDAFVVKVSVTVQYHPIKEQVCI